MGKYEIIIPEPVQKQISSHNKSGDKSIIKKIEKILIELENTPYSGIGNPEQLKYNLTGFWSRRINQKHRLVYKVEETLITVLVVSAMGHYNDK